MANFFKELFAGERSIWTGARNEKYYERQEEQHKASAAAAEASAEEEKAPSVQAAEQAAAEDIRKKQRAIKRNRTIYTTPLGLSDLQASDLTLKTLLGE